jgi:glycosyltransferase involved in cell wall biosynthesis/peptidoglycan/xylan/chitin deacetylase (PgdA/CDA1 family)
MSQAGALAPRSGAPPRFSVVIPTYQRRDVVLGSVRALARQSTESFEVIVVVDGSTDGTAQSLAAMDVPFRLEVIEQANAGRAAAVNLGASRARGEVLLVLDDDMEAEPSLLAEHDRLQREGVDVVLGHVPLHPESPDNLVSRAVGHWAESRARRLSDRPAEIPLSELITGQMSIRRDVFLAVGGFDTGFTRMGAFGNEDLDLGHRLREAGHRIEFHAGAVSRQRYVVTPRRYLAQWRDVGRADVRLARKHPGEADAIEARYARQRHGAVWRLLRLPLRALALTVASIGAKGGWATRLFFFVRDLEYARGFRQAGGPLRSRPVRVLCYHAIADLAGRPVLEPYGVPPDEFERQIELVSRRCNVIDAAEFARFLGGGALPRRPVLLTFDDCYEDLLSEGLPVLLRHGAPGLAFAVTAHVGGTNSWDAPTGAPELPLLGAPGLKTLAANGIAIGSHSRTHPMLNRIDAGELRAEVEGSVHDFDALGLPRPQFLAYPHGEHDELVRQEVAAAGFSGAFTVDPGLARPEGERYAVPRLEVLRADVGWRFAWKLVSVGRRRPSLRPALFGRAARSGSRSPRA